MVYLPWHSKPVRVQTPFAEAMQSHCFADRSLPCTIAQSETQPQLLLHLIFIFTHHDM